MITNLGGHSGCKVQLVENNDNTFFVRKISSGTDYNERLKHQMEKQKSFSSKAVKSPSVIASGYTDNGLFFFDMDYVQGITMAKYIMSVEIDKIRQIVATLSENVMVRSSEQSTDAGPFIKKIESLKIVAGMNDVYAEAYDMLSYHDWTRITTSSCHGDLTLENIIVKGDQLYVIDFLDSFYDSWVIDVGTLLQDVQMLWSYRYEDHFDINAVIRLIVFRDVLIDKLKEAAPSMVEEAYYCLLLKLMRIIPYAKDCATQRFLIDRVDAVANIIKSGELI